MLLSFDIPLGQVAILQWETDRLNALIRARNTIRQQRFPGAALEPELTLAQVARLRFDQAVTALGDQRDQAKSEDIITRFRALAPADQQAVEDVIRTREGEIITREGVR
jgi:hypothetical protein